MPRTFFDDLHSGQVVFGKWSLESRLRSTPNAVHMKWMTASGKVPNDLNTVETKSSNRQIHTHLDLEKSLMHLPSGTWGRLYDSSAKEYLVYAAEFHHNAIESFVALLPFLDGRELKLSCG
jgi:hypothetical protein